MAGDRLLKTFLHISDLHVGDRVGGSQAGPYDAKVEWYIRVHGLMEGLLGHRHDALEQLEDFLNRDLAGQAPGLIVSGDLTRNGAPNQFALTQQFLNSQLTHPHGQAGLRQRSWKQIPGNHDHWPGKNLPLGAPAVAINAMFPLPQIISVSIGANYDAEFLCINTDADVDPDGLHRLLAIGVFYSQLNWLRQNAGAKRGNSFRILVMHHSLSHRAGQADGRLEIEAHCRTELEKLLVELEVSVILSGHTHVPLLNRTRLQTESGAREVLEARCGTSARTEEYPGAWLQWMGAPRQLERNSLLVHHVLERAGRIIWRSAVYRRSSLNNQRFTDASTMRAGNPWIGREEIEVLP